MKKRAEVSIHFLYSIISISVPLVISGIYVLAKLLRKNERKRFSIIEDGDAKDGILNNSPYPATWNSLGLEQPLVIAMVGLPARGKSYIVKMIIRYLSWTGFDCIVFNVGSHRRQLGLQGADASFFDTNNEKAKALREEMAMNVQDDMYAWLNEQKTGPKRRVAIFDATNTTAERRLTLAYKARKENVFLLFVESICDDKSVLAKNYEMKLQNDDYKNVDPDIAKKDFMERVEAYEKVYEPIDDDEDSGNISYVKLINVGQKIIARNCTGYLPSQVSFYLQNVHIHPRKIYLSLNSENFDLVEDLYHLKDNCRGTDSGRLTEDGRRYSLDLARFIQYQQEHDSKDLHNSRLGKEVLVLAGTAKVHAETILHLRMLYSCYNTPLLNELRGGDLHGLNVDEIKKKFPDEFEKRLNDKLRYRYPGPGGESYIDVIERIKPVIIELERQRRSVVVVCHLAVLRCIYAYFMGSKLEDIPYKPIRRHCVYELTPGPFGCTCTEFNPSDLL